MKVFISVDMEGISGLVNWKEPQEKVSREMTADLIAAIEGAFEGGADEVFVADSHALGMNIDISKLPVGTKLIKGFPRPYYMMAGLDESFDIAFFIGYHAPAGYINGLMDHTYSSSSFFAVKINGEVVGETEINALYAGEKGVPVGLITGDHALYKFSKPRFPEFVEFVITKEGFSKFSGLLYHPEEVRSKIKETAKKVVQRAPQIPVFKMPRPYEIELIFLDSLKADIVAQMPFVERTGGRSVKFTAKSAELMMRFINTAAILAASTKLF